MSRPLPLVVGGPPHVAGMQGRRLQKRMQNILLGSSLSEFLRKFPKILKKFWKKSTNCKFYALTQNFCCFLGLCWVIFLNKFPKILKKFRKNDQNANFCANLELFASGVFAEWFFKINFRKPSRNFGKKLQIANLMRQLRMFSNHAKVSTVSFWFWTRVDVPRNPDTVLFAFAQFFAKKKPFELSQLRGKYSRHGK